MQSARVTMTKPILSPISSLSSPSSPIPGVEVRHNTEDEKRRKRRRMILEAYKNIEQDSYETCLEAPRAGFSSSLDEQAGLLVKARATTASASSSGHNLTSAKHMKKEADKIEIPLIKLRPRKPQRRWYSPKKLEDERDKTSSSFKPCPPSLSLPLLPSLPSHSTTPPVSIPSGRDEKKQPTQNPLPPPPRLKQISQPTPSIGNVRNGDDTNARTKIPATPTSFPSRIVSTFEFTTPTQKTGAITPSPAFRQARVNAISFVDCDLSLPKKRINFFSKKKPTLLPSIAKPRAMRPSGVRTTLHFTPPCTPSIMIRDHRLPNNKASLAIPTAFTPRNSLAKATL